MEPSRFIKAMHPKTEIRPDAAAITRILQNGWIGQCKIHGHRAQIHIAADPKEPVVAYNRQGKRHQKPVTSAMAKELRRLFRPSEGWTVLDAEWLKPEDKLFVFDLLKLEGDSLRSLTFPERWQKLPRHFISPRVCVLPLLKDLAVCLKELHSSKEYIEGLVFKSSTSTGFADSSIVRCRRMKRY